MQGEIAGAKEISLEDTRADFAAAKGASQRRRGGEITSQVRKRLDDSKDSQRKWQSGSVNGALVDLNLVDGVLSGATGVAGAANLIPGEIKLGKAVRVGEQLAEMGDGAKTATSHAFEDAVTGAKRFAKRIRYAAEDSMEDAAHRVKHDPFGSVGLGFASASA